MQESRESVLQIVKEKHEVVMTFTEVVGGQICDRGVASAPQM